MPWQPLLHDLVTCVTSPTAVLSAPDGQVRPTGAQGAFVADVRVISRAELTVSGAEPEPVTAASPGADTAEFIGVVRALGDDIPDPTVWVRRTRVTQPTGYAETIRLANVTTGPVSTTVELSLAADLAQVEAVKAGRAGDPVPFRADQDGFVLRETRLQATVHAPGARCDATNTGGRLRWDVVVPARGLAEVGWTVRVADPDAVVVPAAGPVPFAPPAVSADDRRLARFVTRAVEDLAALRMSTVDRPHDQFLAAGAPWYLTLFGRDAIWAARMLLPLGTGVAEGTLRTLAGRQGVRVDPETAEEPGKILHELRRAQALHGGTPRGQRPRDHRRRPGRRLPMTTLTTPTPRRAPLEPLSTEREQRTGWRVVKQVLAYLVLIVFAVLYIYPFLIEIATSFKSDADATANPLSLIPTTWTTEAFQTLGNVDFPRWFVNSAVVAIFVTLGRLFFDSLAGYALARLHFAGRRALGAAIIAVMAVPGVVLLIPKYLVLVELHMFNTYFGMIVPLLADAAGVFIMRQFFIAIPVEVEEAARIDGAGIFRTFWSVVLPMARPALITLTILSFQGSWNEFTHFLIARNSQDLNTLTTGVAQLISGQLGAGTQYPLKLAAALLMTIPTAVVFFVFQRYFIRGASAGAVKG